MMTELFKTRFAARPVSTLGLLALCVAVVATAAVVAATAVHLTTFAVGAEKLAVASPSGSAGSAVLSFRYRGVTRFVHVDVDPDELAAARRLDTSRVFSTVGAVRRAYVRTLVGATARSTTVERIASQLRAIRSTLALDDDAYVELIARFVQEIPYGTLDNEVRLPVEVVSEGSGVCDDKSVLLAALLVHEGFDTAVWAFDSQAHAAVGVRCAGPGMRGSGYAYIETTVPAFVGQIGGTYGSYAAWRRAPQLVPVGGTKRYTADLESEFVAGTLERARSAARRLEPYWALLGASPSRWRPEYEEAARRQAAAHRLASRLSLARDDRDSAYDLLTGGGGR